MPSIIFSIIFSSTPCFGIQPHIRSRKLAVDLGGYNKLGIPVALGDNAGGIHDKIACVLRECCRAQNRTKK
jgi:hypothetical protein